MSQPKAASESQDGRTCHDPAKAPRFEDMLAELQAIVQELERGDLDLSATLARYEQGIRCLRFCHDQLEQAERRVELLKQMDSQGMHVTECFDEQAMTLDQKAAARDRRRSVSRPTPSGDRSAVDVDDELL
jgi:exodeoxyribonuclease VII small subunit